MSKREQRTINPKEGPPMCQDCRKPTYAAVGSVRGSCGHAHRTYGAAARCAARDDARCARLGGGAYSDRTVGMTLDRPDYTRERV
jgi:hypothetical protein